MMTFHKITKVIEHFTGKPIAGEVVVKICNNTKNKLHAFTMQLQHNDGSECPETTCYVLRDAKSIEDFNDVFVEIWLKHHITFQSLPDEYFASNICGLRNEICQCQSKLNSNGCDDDTQSKRECLEKYMKSNEAWRKIRNFSMLSEEEQELRGIIMCLWKV